MVDHRGHLMAIKLREYQEKLKAEVYEAWKTHKNVLMILPTGGGKTRLFTSIAIDHAIKSSPPIPTSIAVHRKELVQQISLTLSEEGVPHNIIAPRPVILGIVAAQRQMFKKQFYDYNSNITVVSVDTLNSRILKHEKWAKSVRLWITDEAAHLLKENKWGRAVKYFTEAKGLGVTATPQRLDKRGLGSHVDGVFDTMVEGPGSKWLIDNGFLSKYKIVIPESDYKLHLKKATEGSDYSKEAMTVASQKSHIVGDVVVNQKKFAEGKQTIVFASDIEAGHRMQTEFIKNGVIAKLLTGLTEDKERFEAMMNYREKKIEVLINVDLFDEGLDVPGIECVIMARPTKSLGKFLQMCLDEKTEILTNRGWLKYNQILSSDKVAGFDTQDNSIDWCDIQDYVCRDREPNEKMFSFASTNLNFRITSQHDVITKSRHSISWIKETIDLATQRKDTFHVPISGLQKIKPAKITDNEIRFLGWFLTDGTRRPKKDESIVIYQCSNQLSHLEHIRKTLQGCNFKFGEYESKRTGDLIRYDSMIHFTVPKSKPKRNFKGWDSVTGWEKLEPWLHKNIPEIYDTLDERQLWILLETMNLGDGCKRKNVNWKTRTITLTCGDNKIAADRLQSLLVRKGFRCNQAEENREKLGRKNIYNLHIRKLTTSSIAGVNVKDGNIEKKSYIRSRIIEETEVKNEIVWCVQNRLGTLITRREGKVMVMGNCGRGLRPAKDKPFMILIDHVGNVSEHGLPDSKRKWTLDRIVKRREKINLIRICKNWECNSPFDRVMTECPYCGYKDVPKKGAGGGRVGPSMVDGDLVMIDPDTIRELEAAVQLESPGSVGERVGRVAGKAAATRAVNNQIERISTQADLAAVIAMWAGVQRHERGLSDRSIHKLFYVEHGKTITQALAEPRAEMLKMIGEIDGLRGLSKPEDSPRSSET